MPKYEGRLTSDLIDRFTATMRDYVTTGEIGLRKAYIGSVVDRIEVDDRKVRILGRKDVLEQCVMAGIKPGGAVRSFVRGWLANRNQDANRYVLVIPL